MKACVLTKQVRRRRIKRSHVLDKASLKKRKEKLHLWKRHLKIKDAEVQQYYCRMQNQVLRSKRKAARDQEKNIAWHVKSNSKMFWNYIESKNKVEAEHTQFIHWWKNRCKDGKKQDIKATWEGRCTINFFFQLRFVKSWTEHGRLGKRNDLTWNVIWK